MDFQPCGYLYFNCDPNKQHRCQIEFYKMAAFYKKELYMRNREWYTGSYFYANNILNGWVS